MSKTASATPLSYSLKKKKWQTGERFPCSGVCIIRNPNNRTYEKDSYHYRSRSDYTTD
jgi:hypothetical protein